MRDAPRGGIDKRVCISAFDDPKSAGHGLPSKPDQNGRTNRNNRTCRAPKWACACGSLRVRPSAVLVDGRLGCSGSCECRADQRRKGLRAGLPHDGRTMVVDGALADAEIGGDVLAWVTSEDEIQDLALTRGQAGDA